jgi:hypothetical protein
VKAFLYTYYSIHIDRSIEQPQLKEPSSNTEDRVIVAATEPNFEATDATTTAAAATYLAASRQQNQTS